MDADYLELCETKLSPPDPFPPAGAPEKLASPAASLFGVRIGSVGLLASSSMYCEVLGDIPVNPLPNVVPWLSGLLNLRGNLVPVFDLHRVLGEEAADPRKRRLFVIGRGDKAAALWIDGLPEIKESGQFGPAKKLASSPKIQQRFVSDSFEANGQVWLQIHFEDLFEALGRHHYLPEDQSA